MYGALLALTVFVLWPLAKQGWEYYSNRHKRRLFRQLNEMEQPEDNWRIRLHHFAATDQWDEAIRFMLLVINKYPDDVWGWISTLYLPHQYIRALQTIGQPDPLLVEDMVELSYCFLADSCPQFADNPEYLFFAGCIISDKLFVPSGRNPDMPPLDGLPRGYELRAKAHQLAPDNLLFAWAHSRKGPDPAHTEALRQQVLASDDLRNWLGLHDYPGQYVLRLLQQP